MVPILMLVFVIVFLGSIVSTYIQYDGIFYDEKDMQRYANEQYRAAFEEYDGRENNIMIVFLTEEDTDGYYTIAWVGDNLNNHVNMMFGDESTAFGRAMYNYVSDDHGYSLSSNLASVVEQMQYELERLSLDSHFRKDPVGDNVLPSHLINHSTLELNGEMLDDVLTDFTEATDIPIVIVVGNMEEVFGKGPSIFTILVLLGFAVIAVVLIVKAVKGSKKKPNGEGGDGNDQQYTSGSQRDSEQGW